MLDRHQAPPGEGQRLPPSLIRTPRTEPKPALFAKFPPDDDDVPAGPGGGSLTGGGGGGFGDEGNFKRGRFKPVAIVVALLLAAGGGAALYFGAQAEGQKMTVEAISAEKKSIFVLSQKDQLPRWRKWAADSNEPALQQEALIQLAWAEDPDGIPLATKALALPDHRVRGVAAQVLAYFGTPRADGAKPALLEALKTADDSDRPQIVWSLVTLKEASVFPTAMTLYRSGLLNKVERLGGGPAFDPEALARLVPLDEVAKLAGDESPSVRQLVANLLSRNAESKWTSVLVQLVKDKDPEVGREAATGLGKIGDEAARGPLLQALSSADKDSRQKFLEALRDGIGGEGLVLALDSVKDEPQETAWFQTRQLMEMLRELADPRAGDALVRWVEKKKPAEHWVGETGIRLAEIGDVRGAKYLGERMKHEPAELYKLERFWEADDGGHLSRTDLSRVVGSRMLADLAVLYPEKKAELKAAAEDSVLAWSKARPQPHANALRFLAASSSEKALVPMREWAFPTKEFPKEGQQPPFPPEFETAQSALRYIGWMKDESSFPKLLDQLKRKKDKKLIITREGLQGAGVAMLGMTLRAVAYGASQGLAQWGDPRAVKPLMELIEDETWHEEARQAACDALAWCADDKTMGDVVKKTKEFIGKKDPAKQFIGSCYAQTLTLRPVPSAAPSLVELLTPDLPVDVRMSVARAIGVNSLDAGTEAKLFEKLSNVEVRSAAALALVMGGSTDTASRAVAMFADFGKDALDDFKDHYFRAFGYWSDQDFKQGNLYRWVANATAISRVKIADVPQDWARQRLQSQFDDLRFDNGPHSETRVVLRHRLFEAAKTGDAATKKGAVDTLKFMKEKGVLMALRHEPGEGGELARRAFYELMNPKLLAAEDLSKLKPVADAKKGSAQP